jgi:putative transposase
MPFRRRTVRLPHSNYLGKKVHFVTICCDRRSPHLDVRSTAEHTLAILFECAAQHAFLVHAYCAMPDHLHFLVHGTEVRCDLLEFVRAFKLRSAFHFQKRHGIRLWEMSYYDHVIRAVESIERIACYIWANPVRKRLAIRPEDFPFSGSQTIDWMKQASTANDSFCPPWKPIPPV